MGSEEPEQPASDRPKHRETLTVLVCRGCCCGTERKHPEVDHAAQLEALRRAAEISGARVRVTDCLGPCERANVVVVRTGTGAVAETVWLGGLLEPQQTTSLCAWIEQGAHGAMALPSSLGDVAFRPTDEASDDLDASVAPDDDALPLPQPSTFPSSPRPPRA